MQSPSTKSRHDAARKAARARWGQYPVNVNLGKLDDEQRALVHAFVRMAEAVAAKHPTDRAA